jgi:hypothetical protein
MMVRDNQRQPKFASRLSFSHARDAAVDGYNDIAALPCNRPQRFMVEAVTFLDAVGHIVIGFCPQQPQTCQQDGRRRHAVGVIISIDCDAPTGPNRIMKNFGGVHCSRQLFWIAQAAQPHIEKLPRAIGVANTAANKKLGNNAATRPGS